MIRQVLGPWGTSRTTERRYGYPPPRAVPASVHIEDLERRIALLEELLSEGVPPAPVPDESELAPVDSEVALMPGGRLRLAWR